MGIVQTHKAITIKYLMRSCLPDGTVKDHRPETISFVFGVERQLPSLEKALEGCRGGETLHVDISASEIYGEHDPSLIKEIPKKGLRKQRLKEGQFYRQMKMGTLVSFKVLEIRERTILADFNKPLTGIKVSMDVRVLAVKEATPEEIKEAKETQAKKNIGCG